MQITISDLADEPSSQLLPPSTQDKNSELHAMIKPPGAIWRSLVMLKWRVTHVPR